MFKKHGNLLKRSFNDIKDTGSELGGQAVKMAKEFKKLPWKKLPPEGWIYIGVLVVFFIIVVTIILPCVVF